MANFTGDVAGLLMIALILVLLFRFIWEMFGKKEEHAVSLKKSMGLYAGLALATAFAIIITGGIIYSFHTASTPLLDYEIMWRVKPIDGFLTVTDTGAYDFNMFTEWKLFPLFPLMAQVLSKLLFGMFKECGLYISLLCGVITTVCLGFTLEKNVGKDHATDYILTFLCVPGIIFIFMPSGFALFACFMAAAILAVSYRKKIPALILAVLSIGAHIFGIGLLLYVIYALFVNKKNEWALLVCAFIMIISGFVIGTTSYMEMVAAFAIALVPVLPKKSNENLVYVRTLLIILSGFHIFGLMYSVF